MKVYALQAGTFLATSTCISRSGEPKMFYKLSQILRCLLFSLLGFLLTFVFTLNTSFANSNLCFGYLEQIQSVGTDRNSQVLRYLSIISDENNTYKIETRSEIKQSLSRIYERIKASPNDLNLLKAFWFTSRLLSSENKNLEIKNRQIEVALSILRLEKFSDENRYNYYLSLREAGEFQKSLQVIKSLIKQDPMNSKYVIAEIRSLISVKDFPVAIEKSESALGRDSENLILMDLTAQAHVSFANSEVAQGRYNTSKYNLRRADELLKVIVNSEIARPSHSVDYAHVLYNIGKYNDLLDFLEFNRFPLRNVVETKLKLKTYARLLDFDAAEIILEKALKLYGHLDSFKKMQIWFEDFRQRHQTDSLADYESNWQDDY
jgi:tetratricopeptide (TPR) repeat protein